MLTTQEAFRDYGDVSSTRTRRTSDPEGAKTLISEEGQEKIRPKVGIRSTSFDPRSKTEPVHGVESAGLGTSTFLEGAPAPKSAIERANAEEEQLKDGLVRKKSLVQKIKVGRRTTGGERSPPLPLAGPVLSQSGDGKMDSAYNPFFKEGQFVEKIDSMDGTKGRDRADSGESEKAANGTGGLIGRVKSLKISGARKSRASQE